MQTKTIISPYFGRFMCFFMLKLQHEVITQKQILNKSWSRGRSWEADQAVDVGAGVAVAKADLTE
ncbi:MAG: hypothetical protein K2G81_05655, partial [Muribaculaceae bacterium]|nr:hypothetical protein [Muribaculaceae bacterium]